MDRYGRFVGWPPASSYGRPAHPGGVPIPGHGFGYPWIVTPVGFPVTLPPRESPLPPAGDDGLTTSSEPAPPGLLNPFIAVGHAAVVFDLRKEPRKANRGEFDRHDRYSLFSHPVKDVRLISRDFPWPIEIRDEWVVCGKVWEKIYHELQVYITESEWAMMSEDRRRVVERAVRRREAESGNRDMRPKRIDWLGEGTLFVGLERDDSYARRIALPGRRDGGIDTWVIRMAKP